MSKDKKLSIPKFYRCNAEDLLLFAWVEGIRHVMPAVQIQKSIELFKEHFDITEDQWAMMDAYMNYARTKKKFSERETNEEV